MAEILAPAGNLDMAIAALDAGADAIYPGPKGWSRRTIEQEVTDEDLQTMITYAQKSNKKVKVVMNTYPAPFEMEIFKNKIKKYYEMGASGFIVTDVGVVKMIREMCPDVEIHVSIGAGVSNALEVKFFEDAGADAIMPLAAPIGSGLGIQNPYNIAFIKDAVSVPVLVDAGLGCASDAASAMELGAEGILANTAIAQAQNPMAMAEAFKYATIAGRLSYLAGRIPKKHYATASSPIDGLIQF